MLRKIVLSLAGVLGLLTIIAGLFGYWITLLIPTDAQNA